jgi:hypothetical protein
VPAGVVGKEVSETTAPHAGNCRCQQADALPVSVVEEAGVEPARSVCHGVSGPQVTLLLSRCQPPLATPPVAPGPAALAPYHPPREVVIDPVYSPRVVFAMTLV